MSSVYKTRFIMSSVAYMGSFLTNTEIFLCLYCAKNVHDGFCCVRCEGSTLGHGSDRRVEPLNPTAGKRRYMSGHDRRWMIWLGGVGHRIPPAEDQFRSIPAIPLPGITRRPAERAADDDGGVRNRTGGAAAPCASNDRGEAGATPYASNGRGEAGAVPGARFRATATSGA